VRALYINDQRKELQMRRLNVLGLALLAIFALGIISAATASAALPDLSQLAGEAYPAKLEGEEKSADILETISGSKVTGTSVSLTLELAELSALGAFTAAFRGVKEKTNPCSTSGDAKEVVLVHGEYHIVLLVGGASYGIVFLVGGFTIECGEPVKTKIKVKGDAIASLPKPEIGTDVTELGGVLEGSKGKNNITEYLNNGGTAVKGILESNFGLGYEQSMEEITGELKLKVLNGKMIVIEKG
jgi:hypothetical protein